MKNLNFHKDFLLNEEKFDTNIELLNYAKNCSKSIYIFLSDWFNDNDFVVVKTSGSTGKPKEIRLKKEYMINSAMATGEYFDLQSKITALLCLPTDFIAGKVMLVRALTLGWRLDIVEASSNPLKSIKKQYDFSAMIPMQVLNSLAKLSQINKLIIGGGVVSNELEAQLQNINTICFATYGMTETITHIAARKLNNFSVIANEAKQSVIKSEITSSQVPRNEDNHYAELDSVSHYKTLPNVSISKDNRGCLVINAPKVSDEVVVTNDLVEILSKTEFKWLGRYDTIINSGGIKLIPEQIELKLTAIIDNRFFVAGIPDTILGEKLLLIIEQDVISSEYEKSVILNEVKNLKSLSKYEVPKEIYFLPNFIETETKKIQRQKTLDLIFTNK